MARLCSSLLLSLLIAASASAVTMDWTPVGEPGNAADTTGFGAVAYSYNIGTYEVTNAQYAEFLNAKAASDPLGLYNTSMANPGFSTYGSGITRTGSDGSYAYSPIAGRENMPVNLVSFYDAIRFANWMNNGQGNGDTETGAYTITADGIANNSITRNAGATIVRTSEDEWYKAAFYDAATMSYFDYPARSDLQTMCSAPTVEPNSANCFLAVQDLTPVGSYTNSSSPYGTFDQGGNVFEWNEAIIGTGRGDRGGSFDVNPIWLLASMRGGAGPSVNGSEIGFRLAMIPEPSTGLLVVAGLLGLAGWRSARA